jgi:hypothetical protein
MAYSELSLRTVCAAAVATLALTSLAAFAQAPSIASVDHFTENRGWNQAGLGPMHQVVIAARVVPAGMPTLVFAESGGAREALTHFPQPDEPDLYVMWKRYEPGAAATWRLVAERDGAVSASVDTPALQRAQRLPLADVRINGGGTRPTLRWGYSGLEKARASRIRVGVRGGELVHGRFLSLLRVFDALPPSATSFRIPAGALVPGERYVFQVMLEDTEDGALKNRSMSFSDPYVATAETKR